MALRNGYSTIGLDLGDTSAKMVQLKAERGGRWRIHAAAHTGYGPPVEDDGDEQRVRTVGDAVKRMLAEGRFVGRNVATVLPRADALIRPVKLPGEIDPGDKEKIWEALQSEARRYLPYPVEEAVLDFVTVGTVRDDEGEKLEVLLIFARQDTVNQHLSLIESTGLRCICVDTVPCAVSRTAERMVGEESSEAIATVEMGDRATVVSISHSGQLLFSRTVKTGGGTLTDAIAEKLDLTREKAEMFKRNHGIDHRMTVRAEFSDGTRIPPSDIPAVIHELCQEQLSQLASELKRSVEYFVAQFSGAKVERGILFGGGANLKGLPDFLHDKTGLKVHVGDPFVSVNTDNGDLEERIGDNWPSFAVALGLALRKE